MHDDIYASNKKSFMDRLAQTPVPEDAPEPGPGVAVRSMGYPSRLVHAIIYESPVGLWVNFGGYDEEFDPSRHFAVARVEQKGFKRKTLKGELALYLNKYKLDNVCNVRPVEPKPELVVYTRDGVIVFKHPHLHRWCGYHDELFSSYCSTRGLAAAAIEDCLFIRKTLAKQKKACQAKSS